MKYKNRHLWTHPKVVAIDVYGTFLSADDLENAVGPRRGFDVFVSRLKSRGIKLVTASDAPIEIQKLDIAATFKGRVNFGLEIFDGFYQLAMRPKRYIRIIDDLGIMNSELMVIGDQIINDLAGAPVISHHFLVPPYTGLGDSFNFNEVTIP